MSQHNSNLPPLRPPPRPHSPSGHRSQSSLSQTSLHSESSLSTTSTDSSVMAPPPLRRPPYNVSTRPSTAGEQSGTPFPTVPRTAYRTSVDVPSRGASPPFNHRARQHSQGFFEPSLPALSASQIAAQAAMSPPPGNDRKRSYPGLPPINTTRQPSSTQSPMPYGHSNSALGANLTSTIAANAAFPNGRSPLPSPSATPPEPKSKSSKMKLFSKPKNISLSKAQEGKITSGMPSPGKGGISSSLLRSGFANASTTSLLDPAASSASSLYSSANASTSTLVPISSEKEKEKRHHFLSRQKLKHKDEPSALSSAHSNSQFTNPEKPAPLYSFTPDSPGPNSFSKSMSGFDLRHGGRALREKKKEEKAAAAAARLDLTPIMSHSSTAVPNDQYLGPTQNDTSLGAPSSNAAAVFAFPSDTSAVSAQAFSNIGVQMGLPGLGPDDAWPLLKARLLNLFSGEDLRTPIEDFNMLVNVHIRRCIQRKSPIVLVEDLRELLQTGFTSLSQTLRGVSDDRLVSKLVEIWVGVYGSILPFLQAVFLPLDLEFKGRGVIMSGREAQDFWWGVPESLKSDHSDHHTALGEDLDVRRITLISFRDTVILPQHEPLLAIFSRLALDSIASASPAETVARMLQCLAVLAGCQTGDTGQGGVERLTGELKYNWLGRGRTGRDRRGWVGVKQPVGGGQQRVGLVGA